MLRSRHVAPVSIKQTLFIVTGCAVCAAWFSAAMTPRWHQPAMSEVPSPAPVESGAVLAREIARLHERLRPDVAPRSRLRNVFAFQAARPAVAGVPRTAPVADAGPAPVPVAPFALTLVGLAEEPAGSSATAGLVRTAIISGHGQLFLLKEGETLTDGAAVYTTGPIDATSVEVTDQRDGRAHRLTLK
jgi:hypothetical protein